MTRKDYVLIADAIAVVQGEVNRQQYADADMVLARITEELSYELRATNPRFDRARFIAACRKGSN